MHLLAAGLGGWGVFVWSVGPLGARRRLSTAKQLDLPRITRKKRSENARLAREACDAMADELSAGTSPADALVRATDGLPAHMFVRARTAAMLGDDVVRALRRDAAATADPLLDSMAACWSVGERSGVGLAHGLRSLARTASERDQVKRELATALAGPRATAKVLAGLPLVGLAMGSMLGVKPLVWLTASPLGWGCLLAGVGLTVLGGLWTKRIVGSVERRLR